MACVMFAKGGSRYYDPPHLCSPARRVLSMNISVRTTNFEASIKIVQIRFQANRFQFHELLKLWQLCMIKV